MSQGNIHPNVAKTKCRLRWKRRIKEMRASSYLRKRVGEMARGDVEDNGTNG
jgi:hypothetical protein